MNAHDPVRWSVHPLRSEPWLRSLGLIVSVLGFATLFTYAFDSGAIGVLAGAVLTVTVSSYLLPTHYEVGASGIRISRVGSHKTVTWFSIERVERHPDGFFVSPYNNPSRLDSFRGSFVRLPIETGTCIRNSVANLLSDHAL